MAKILLSNHYEGAPLEILRNAIAGDFELEVLDELSEDELRERIVDADYLLVSGRMKISGQTLDCAQKLKMIQRTGVGLDSLDLNGIKARGIPLYVNAGVNSTSVAEHALCLMLAALRRSYFVNRQIRSGIWKKQETGLTTHELAGKTVGVVGMGNIGRKVARRVAAFDARILYYDAFRLKPEDETALDVEFCSMDHLIENADIITLHCPASDDGPILGATEFARMRNGAIVINTARGSLIDMAALVECLNSGKLSAAGIDVYDSEPIAADHPILACENAVLSPHIGGVTYEAFASMMSAAVDNMRAFEAGDLSAIESSRYL